MHSPASRISQLSACNAGHPKLHRTSGVAALVFLRGEFVGGRDGRRASAGAD